MLVKHNCVACKGRLWCGEKCRVLEHFSRIRSVSSKVHGTVFSGSSPPSLLVSWKNYPDVRVSPLAPPEFLRDADLLDNPEKWFGLEQERLLELRESLIGSSAIEHVFSAQSPGRFLSEVQELAMAQKQVDVEVELKKPLTSKLSFDGFLAPIGPIGDVKRFSLYSLPKVPEKIDYLVSDTDVKAGDALKELYSSRIPVHSLSKLLSAGLLGGKRDRRLVPTRWAITATDSKLSDEMIERVRYFPQLSEFELFESTYLDNHFIVLLLPMHWGFEQLEAWKPGSPWALSENSVKVISDFEAFRGRKDYAAGVAGAYYAARLAVCEHLMEAKRQAAAVIFREIGEGYSFPLGVWVIRQTIRDSLQRKPVYFSSMDLALGYLSNKLSVPLKFWAPKSRLLDAFTHQKRLPDFN